MTEDNLPEQYTAGPTSIRHRQTMLAPDQFYKIETHDRRCRNRYPVSLEIEYMILACGHLVRSGNGTTINISSNGILFRTDDTLEPGASIKMAIKWPFLLEDLCALKVHILGIVVWCDIGRAAMQISHYEFRTASVRSNPKPTKVRAGVKQIQRNC